MYLWIYYNSLYSCNLRISNEDNLDDLSFCDLISSFLI